jgi:hypothetical protein
MSVVGLVGSVGLWAASYSRITYIMDNQDIVRLHMGAVTWFPADRFTKAYGNRIYPLQPKYKNDGFQGFHTRWVPSTRVVGLLGSATALVIPLWMPSLMFGIVLVAFICPQAVHRRRRRFGLCIACGYTLQGSPGDRCSECGHERG